MEEMLLLMKNKKCKPGKVIYTTMIQAYIAHGMDETAKLLEMEVERFDNKLMVIKLPIIDSFHLLFLFLNQEPVSPDDNR
jgi:hypothetical protein